MTNYDHGSKGILTIQYSQVRWSVPIVEARKSLNVAISIPLPPSTNDMCAEIAVTGAEADVAWLLALIRNSLESNDGERH